MSYEHYSRVPTPPLKFSTARTYALRAMLHARDDYTCRECGYRFPDVPIGYDGRRGLWRFVRGKRGVAQEGLEVDHIVPRILGGPSTPDNLQTLCMWCNKSKGCRLDLGEAA